MAEMETKEYDLVDDAGKGFAADVAVIVTKYREQTEALFSKKTEAEARAKRIESEAEDKYRQAAAKAKTQCAARIRQAAKVRADKSDRPEQIEKVCNSYLTPILADNGGGMFEPSFILDRLQEAEKARLDTEADDERRYRRVMMKRGLR